MLSGEPEDFYFYHKVPQKSYRALMKPLWTYYVTWGRVKTKVLSKRRISN